MSEDARGGKELALALIEDVWNQGNVDAYPTYAHPDTVLHLAGYPDPFVGLDAVMGWARSYREAFPDIQIEVEEMLSEGSSVFVRWTSSQTHTGAYIGIPATGKRASISALQLIHVDGGKMRETWMMFDPLRVMQQLGIFPEGGPPKPLILLLTARQRLKKLFERS